MKHLTRKLKSRGGMSLTELLAALAILALISLAIGAGTGAAVKVHNTSVQVSEASLLESTLTAAIADELRYATEIQPGENGTYRSAVFGAGTQLDADEDGRLTVKDNTPLVGSKTYAKGFTADISYSYIETKKAFQVTLSISGDTLSRKNTFSVAPING